MAEEEKPTKRKVGAASVVGGIVAGSGAAFGLGHFANGRANARLKQHKEDMEKMVEQRTVAEQQALAQFDKENAKPGTERAEQLRREANGGHVATLSQEETERAIADWEARRESAIARSHEPFKERPKEITIKHFGSAEQMAKAEASTAKYAEARFYKKPVVAFKGASIRGKIAMGAVAPLALLGAGYMLRHSSPNDASYTERVTENAQGTQDNGVCR